MFASADLSTRGISLRTACKEDAAFERVLFETARPDAVALAAWPEAARKLFLDQQFEFQSLHYARAYPNADRLLVVADGAAAGRLILDRTPDAWCVVDIALLPAWRGRGIGTLLLQSVLAEAAAAGASAVTLMVDIDNPARRLYQRLGFVTMEEVMPKAAMEWRPASTQLKTA